MKSVHLITATLVLGQAASSCLATPILTLSSSADDLSEVAPGSMLSVSVELTQLEVGDQLDSLAATIVFDSALLGEPVISRGDIVPDPLDDPLDFLSLAEPGIVDVAFTTLGLVESHHITRSGVFYSFSVQALGPGTGSISIDLADGTLFNSADPASPLSLDVIAGTALSYTVVPEPASAALIAHGLTLFWLMSRRRRIPSLTTRDITKHSSLRRTNLLRRHRPTRFRISH